MKRLVSFFTITLLLVVLSLISNVHVGTAQSGLITFISSDTTWTKAGSPYSLDGPIVVSVGVTLTIEAGVTVNFNSYYLTVNGTLRAVGSSADKIRFNGGNISFTGFSSVWNEQAGSGCIIKNAVLTGASVFGASAKIDGCSITAQTVNGYLVSNNVIVGNVNGVNVLGNTITGDVSGSGSVSNNTITGTVSAAGSSLVTHNYVTSGGISCREQSQVSENTITGCQTGITSPALFYQSGGIPLIEKNLITNNTNGISIEIWIRMWVGSNFPIIRNNTISHNSIGIKYIFSQQESGNYPTPNITYNNIQDNTNFNFYLDSPEITVNVTYNWWGTSNQQAINLTIRDYKYDLTLGRVEFVPFLTSANPSALPSSTGPTPTPTPSPSPTPTPTSSVSPTPSQEPTVPEFPATFALAFLIMATIAVAVGFKKRTITKLPT